MKKITLFTFAALALSLASCKKARTCTCTVTQSDITNHTNGLPATANTGSSNTYVNVSSTKLSKGAGKAWCVSDKNVDTAVDTYPTDTKTKVTTTEKTCTLK